MSTQDQQQAIIRAAHEAGIDPSAALAIAERESNFDPNAHSSRTIHGMFQMTGNLRQQYGIGDSNDPETQARGWAAFFKDNKGEMARVLGRDPTDAEGYLGHHFGSVRAARMMRMDPNTPVDQVFTPYEMSVNPHFARAGTVGNLNASVTSDITRRQAKFGGAEAPDLAEFGTPVDASNGTAKINKDVPDLSQYGTVASQGPDPEPPHQVMASMVNPAMPQQAAGMRAVDGDYTRSSEADQRNPGGARNNEITPETLMDLRAGPKTQPDRELDPMAKQPPDLSAQGAPA